MKINRELNKDYRRMLKAGNKVYSDFKRYNGEQTHSGLIVSVCLLICVVVGLILMFIK